MDSWHSPPEPRDTRRDEGRRRSNVLGWGAAALALVGATVALLYFAAPWS